MKTIDEKKESILIPWLYSKHEPFDRLTIRGTLGAYCAIRSVITKPEIRASIARIASYPLT